MKRIAILVSGSGTNMQNLIQRMKSGEIPAEPCLVLSDNPQASAIEKAKKLGVPVHLADRRQFPDPAAFEADMIRELEKSKADWILLAGFMRILSPDFVRRFKGRIINIHPSLLPNFPGAHGIRDAWNARVQETGVSVHYVDEGVDTGPIILQRKVPVDPKDTLETLEAKIHSVEYELYPEALLKIL